MDEARKTLSLMFKVVLIFSCAALLLVTWLFSFIPSDKELKSCLTTKLYHIYLCPSSGNYAPLSQISQNLQKAVLLSEDSAFYQHYGFDLKEIQNSLEKNMKTNKYARGGSTITQQLAKNLFLSTDKTLQRKFLEALITMKLERNLTKKEILEKYLNVVQFGKDIYGIKPAAQFYFHKTPAELSVVESAFLAFLLPSPEKYSQSFYKHKLTAFAQKRLTDIVTRLYQYHKISEPQYTEATLDLKFFMGGLDKNLQQEFDSAGEDNESLDPVEIQVEPIDEPAPL